MATKYQWFLFIAAMVVVTNSEEGACRSGCSTCNCHFNNVEILDHLIETKITSALTGASGCGAMYIRWGRTSCPNVTGAELVYSGRAGGTYFGTQGGAADKICLPEDPDYLADSHDAPLASQIWGAEYEFDGSNSDIRDYNIPCAVCYVPSRSTVLMIPAKTQCPSSWTREYFGYLTAERDLYYRSSFECVDNDPEVIPGSSSHLNGALFFYTKATCNGLACPPYQSHRTLSCTVCTK